MTDSEKGGTSAATVAEETAAPPAAENAGASADGNDAVAAAAADAGKDETVAEESPAETVAESGVPTLERGNEAEESPAETVAVAAVKPAVKTVAKKTAVADESETVPADEKPAKRPPPLLHENDTGSASAQSARLTARIVHLAQHLKAHPKDHHSRRGLLAMVNKRRKQMRYLKRTRPEMHAETVAALGLRK